MAVSVLVVDDSALIRSLMSQIINDHPQLTLVGAAPDAYVAKDMVKQFNPDVITLDIEMPKVDGLTFLDRLMKAKPTPVVMISTLTEKGADATMLALELGAVDFIPKPKINVASKFMEFQQLVTDKILEASRAKVNRLTKNIDPAKKTAISYKGTEVLIAIGASTGGTEAIKDLLMQLPSSCPGIVMTQHMPPGFTTSFAKRLDSTCAMRVVEATHNERVLPGHAYLAPGDKHMEVIRYGADYRIRLFDGEKVSGHKPSVDVLFDSIANNIGDNALGALLTGMGKDGAKGLKAMHDKGCVTFCQNEESCVVYGMPKEAVNMGAADHVVDLQKMAQLITSEVNRKGRGNRL